MCARIKCLASCDMESMLTNSKVSRISAARIKERFGFFGQKSMKSMQPRRPASARSSFWLETASFFRILKRGLGGFAPDLERSLKGFCYRNSYDYLNECLKTERRTKASKRKIILKNNCVGRSAPYFRLFDCCAGMHIASCGTMN